MVYLFLANGFEEIEALTPVDLMRRAGISVTTVGVGSVNITGAHGITVTADIPDTQFSAVPDDIEAVILPGGMPGAKNLSESSSVDSFLTAANKKGALICAICAAPFVLGERGLLSGKKATCYPGFEDKLTGAEVKNKGVVRDGNIITGRAMGSATEFALEIVSAIKGNAVAQSIKKGIIA